MNRSILITGASRGLGFYFVKRYLECGDTVFAGLRDIKAPKLEELKKEYGEKLQLITVDVSDSKSVKEAALTIGQYTDHLEILINNAAIHSASTNQLLEEADFDLAREVLDINSIGPLRVVQALVDLLRKGQNSRIINISSESGSVSTQNRIKEFDYCMSKAALNMASKLLSNYLKDDNIIVKTVHPGWMRTDMGGMNAHLDPYETAITLVELFDQVTLDSPLFIDNQGELFPY